MARSGIKVADECKSAYEGMRIHSPSTCVTEKHRCIVFKMSDDDSEVVVEKCVKKHEEHRNQCRECEDVVKALPGNDGRYIVWDLSLPSKSCGQTGQKTADSYLDSLILTAWIPAGCSVKRRMLYSSTLDTLKQTLVGIKKTYTINDDDDLVDFYNLSK